MTVALRGIVDVFRKANRASEVHGHQFTLNVCQIFAPALLKRITAVIDELPDPLTRTLEPANIDDLSVQSSQDDSSAPESQDEGFRKPQRGRGLNAEFRTMIQNLQRQLEQQRRDFEQQRKDSEQQRKDAKDRETMLVAQLEQQRKDSQQQRKDSEQQRKELVQLLK
ncbi:hypothetical protein LTS17_012724 [Exophiala oligosperma]